MAKKGKNGKASAKKIPENALPQNILLVGERVEEDKNIYIAQNVYKQIQKFTKNKTKNESGGMLLGHVIEEFGKSNVIITGFVEAKFSEATPTTLKFTHETWDYVHKEVEKSGGSKIVGWIHTHPNFGIFLSEYDKFIHKNFFGEAYQVAYVVDPIQKTEGFYFWINSNLERCKGFYIYDKTGTRITVEPPKEQEVREKEAAFGLKNILIAVLTLAVVFLIFSNMSLSKQMKTLQEQQKALVNSANQALYQMQQQLSQQEQEISALKDADGEKAAETEGENTEQETPDGETDAEQQDPDKEVSSEEGGTNENA